jgi:hypothetical protein
MPEATAGPQRTAQDSQRAMVPPVSGGGAPRLTVRRVALACLILATLSLGVLAENLLLTAIGVSGPLLWLVVPPVRSNMGAARSGKPAPSAA